MKYVGIAETCSTAAGAADICVVALGSQVDTRPLAGSRVPRTGLIEGKFLGNGGKKVADVFGRFGRRLEEEKTCLPCVGFGIGCSDGPLIRLLAYQIKLVAGESDDNVFVGLALEFFDPGLGLV